MDRMETICAEIFPDNCIDGSILCTFLKDNDIKSGIIVAYNGLPPGKINDELKKCSNTHFPAPVK